MTALFSGEELPMNTFSPAVAGHQRAIGGNCHIWKNLPEAKLEWKHIPRFYASGVIEAGEG